MQNRAIPFIIVPIILALTLICMNLTRAENPAKPAQKPAQPAKPADVGTSFEEALKKVEAQKAEERKALALKCKENLNKTITTWISQRETQKKSQLNGAIEQDWDRVPDQYFTNVHNDYYLKGFDYSVLSSEIKETESLTAPIKAQAVIKEKIYAEKYHTPDMSDIGPYCFTATYSITLDMEYHQDNFVITNTDTKMISLNNKGYPEELKKLRL